MATLAQSTRWAEEHSYGFLEIFRIVLGLILLQKGLVFVGDSTAMVDSMTMNELPYSGFWLAHYIVMAHLVGGVMIAIGLCTRWAALFQLPILIGAVALVPYEGGGIFAERGSLSLAVFTLVLLVIFCFYGSGRFSADAWLARHRDPEEDHEFDEVADGEGPQTGR